MFGKDKIGRKMRWTEVILEKFCSNYKKKKTKGNELELERQRNEIGMMPFVLYCLTPSTVIQSFRQAGGY